MNVNDTNPNGPDARKDVVELGVASVETKGSFGKPNEGVLHTIMPDISEERSIGRTERCALPFPEVDACASAFALACRTA